MFTKFGEWRACRIRSRNASPGHVYKARERAQRDVHVALEAQLARGIEAMREDIRRVVAEWDSTAMGDGLGGAIEDLRKHVERP